MTLPSVHVESVGDEALAHVLFRSLPVTIDNGGDSSATVSGAEATLALRPTEPVAVLIGTREQTPREVERDRGIITGRLRTWAPERNWYVAFAEKRLLDWVLSDPRLRQAYETSPQDMKIYNERAFRVAELAKTIPFDPTILLRTNEEYRGLVEWIRSHTAQQQQAS